MNTDLVKFLSTLKVEGSDQYYTNGCQMLPNTGKYKIERNNLEEFWELYQDLLFSLKDDFMAGINERPSEFMPILGDIDIAHVCNTEIQYHTSNRITADMARDLCGRTLEEELKYAYNEIRAAAEKGLRKVHLTDNFWVFGGYRSTKQYQKAKAILEKDGFAVDFSYKAHQFIDMYTVVSW